MTGDASISSSNATLERTVSRVGVAVLRASRNLLFRAAPTVLCVLLANFFLLKLMPGDAADVLAGELGSATEETMRALHAHFGLDATVFEQLLNYFAHLAHFSLGFSPRYNAPVLEVISSRLPWTLLLMTSAFAVALLVGISAGAVMATWRNRWPDRVIGTIVLFLYSTPGFWIALTLVVVFSVYFGWLPSDGNVTIGKTLQTSAYLADIASHLLLPAVALSAHFIAIYARLTRAAMVEVARQDFVRTAIAKGVHPIGVVFRHVLRNALIPVTTAAGMHIGNLLGGAATIETVFSWPGLGRLALEAVNSRDYPILLGILLLSSLLVIVANLLVDLLHAAIDPRTRLSAESVIGTGGAD